jgi:hypothetical protein
LSTENTRDGRKTQLAVKGADEGMLWAIVLLMRGREPNTIIALQCLKPSPKARKQKLRYLLLFSEGHFPVAASLKCDYCVGPHPLEAIAFSK